MMMHVQFSQVGAALGAAVLLAASAPSMAEVTWGLADVAFADGGTLTGGFADDGYLLSFKFMSQGGAIAGATYGSGDFVGGAPPYQIDLSIGTYANDLELVFKDSLALPSPDNPLVSGFEQFGSYSDPSLDVSRQIVSGYATSVAEPMSWALTLIGMASVGGALRAGRARRSAAAAGGL